MKKRRKIKQKITVRVNMGGYWTAMVFNTQADFQRWLYGV